MAKWLFDARNPLTARVAVNHIWMRHFGTRWLIRPITLGFRANGRPIPTSRLARIEVRARWLEYEVTAPIDGDEPSVSTFVVHWSDGASFERA